MSEGKELKWTESLVSSLPYLEQTVNEHSLMVIAYFVLNVFGSLVSPAGFWTWLISMVIFQALACDAIRRVWLNFADPETGKEFRLSHGGPPLLSLVLLYLIYWLVGLVSVLMLIAPFFWWVTKSSLAVFAVCIDDLGAIEALKRSHQLVDGRFFRVFSFLFPLALTLGIPCVAVGFGLDYGLSLLPELSGNAIVQLGGITIAALVKAVCGLSAQVMIAASLCRLYMELRREALAEEPQAADGNTIE